MKPNNEFWNMYYRLLAEYQKGPTKKVGDMSWMMASRDLTALRIYLSCWAVQSEN
jgi:hypothetical protein